MTSQPIRLFQGHNEGGTRTKLLKLFRVQKLFLVRLDQTAHPDCLFPSAFPERGERPAAAEKVLLSSAITIRGITTRLEQRKIEKCPAPPPKGRLDSAHDRFSKHREWGKTNSVAEQTKRTEKRGGHATRPDYTVCTLPVKIKRIWLCPGIATQKCTSEARDTFRNNYIAPDILQTAKTP